MKQLILASFFVLLCSQTPLVSQTHSAKNEGLTWHTDLAKVNELAKKSHKPVFAFFTGSDWCGWCHKLEREVFAKPEFVAWANKNVILLELDFPRGKQLPPELAQQNNDLQQAFRVDGFPTIWIFNISKDKSTGKFSIAALGSLGYPRGAESGREEVKFLSEANSVLASAKTKKP